MKIKITLVAVAAAAGLVLAGCGSSGPDTNSIDVPGSSTEGPGDGRYVVALGDSYISGEGGRRVNNGYPKKGSDTPYPGYTVGDASVAYGDGHGKEAIEGCHRSHSAMINVKDGWKAENLACSGAQTKSFTEESGAWKPGLDGGADGKQSQTQMLEAFAKENPVGAVAVSIGGNDMGFSTILGACVQTFLLQSKSYCQNNADVAAELTDENKTKVAGHIAQSFESIQDAMFKAGYEDKDWQLVYTLPPMPLPTGDQVSFPETKEGRITTGRCPIYNTDLDWANSSLLPQIDGVMIDGLNQFMKNSKKGKYSVTLLNDTNAFDGHKLCQDTADRPKTDMEGVSQTPDFDKTGLHAEWVTDIEISDQISGSKAQEEGHPNYWGQNALTSCLRLTVNNASEYNDKEVECVPDGNGLNQWGNPNMKIGEVSAISGG